MNNSASKACFGILATFVGIVWGNLSYAVDEYDVLSVYQALIVVSPGKTLEVQVAYGTDIEQSVSIYDLSTARRIFVSNNHHDLPRSWRFTNNTASDATFTLVTHNLSRPWWRPSYFRVVRGDGADTFSVQTEDGVDANFTDCTSTITIR